MYLGDSTKVKEPQLTPSDRWGWLKALMPDLNINVPANIGVDIKTPDKVNVDVFSSVRKNIVPIAATLVGISGVVVALAYAVRPRAQRSS
jgi:hypothetical protein